MRTADSELTEPEQRLWTAIHTGTLVDLRSGTPALDNPATGHQWGPERSVRAQVLADLLTNPDTHQPSRPPRQPRALRLRGARITGTLDLEAMTLVCPLTLHDCYLDRPVVLAEARAPAIRLPGAHIRPPEGEPALNGEQLETRGNLELNNGFSARGEVRLLGATIGGQLDLSGATLTNPNGTALNADRLTVGQSMFCAEGFSATGEVRLLGATIGGQLDLAGATLTNPGSDALTADGLTVNGAGGMLCGEEFSATGEVRLRGATITSQLDLTGATLTNPNGNALNADGLTVNGAMFCRQGFRASGEVGLLSATITSQLDLTGATLTNPDGLALNADGLTVKSAMFCGEGFSASGEVRLVGATITGQLAFNGATLTNPNGNALTTWGLTVNGSMFCTEGFSASGEVGLPGATITGQLELTGATLTNPDGLALNADGLTVNGSMLCGQGFSANGEVNLAGATIGGQLDLSGATLTNPDGLALDLESASASTLHLRTKTPADGTVDLTNAHVGILYDSRPTWPTSLHLGGFVYDALDAWPPINVKERLGWLKRDPGGYTSQLYEQLIAAYRHAGQEDAARKVAIAKQRRRRTELNRPGKLWNSLLFWTVGYGYRTWQALLWLLGFLVAGWVIFAAAYPTHMTPTKHPPDPTPAFHPVMYALDLLLPVVSLHQQEYWIPRGLAQWWAWVSILAGWVLTTAVVAALTGILKKD